MGSLLILFVYIADAFAAKDDGYNGGACDTHILHDLGYIYFYFYHSSHLFTSKVSLAFSVYRIYLPIAMLVNNYSTFSR